jgi:hypothetical protein
MKAETTCGHAKRYRGSVRPTCLDGDGCDSCWKKFMRVQADRVEGDGKLVFSSDNPSMHDALEGSFRNLFRCETMREAKRWIRSIGLHGTVAAGRRKIENFILDMYRNSRGN